MLSIVFLLLWISVVAALTRAERRRAQRLLVGRIDEEIRAASGRCDHATLVRYYRVLLARRPPLINEQLVRINLACALNGLGQCRKALDVLDEVALLRLSPSQAALWLNNRAYTLILLGRPGDALDNLHDAEQLLVGDDGGERDLALLACISGTRGIALLRLGQLESAEAALRLALALEGEEGGDPGRAAERWFWLSEIARERGDEGAVRERLERAAAFPATEFGARALDRLDARLPCLKLDLSDPLPQP